MKKQEICLKLRNGRCTHPVKHIIDRTVINRSKLTSDREHYMKPYLMHPIKLVLPNESQRFGKLNHYYSKHLFCSTYQSHWNRKEENKENVSQLLISIEYPVTKSRLCCV